MSLTRLKYLRTPRLLIVAFLLPYSASLIARDASLVVAVRAQVAPDYQRVKLANGQFKPERYAIANGGKFPGTTRDESVEKVNYPEIAGVVAQHLAAQQYYLAQKTKEADLLIAIYWGTTIPFNDANYGQATDVLSQAISAERNLGGGTEPAPGGGVLPASPDLTSNIEFAMARIEMENRQRDMLNQNNAKLLGYLDAINDRREMIAWADIGGLQHDLVADVEEERYYVVVRAYDFKALTRDNKQVVRWTTRISIAARGTGFEERMFQMVAAAASSFGQEQGLRRRFYGDPRVDLGDVQYLGVAAPRAQSDTAPGK